MSERGQVGRGVVTSHDVARLAGVSQPTVSRALRDSEKVSRATRDRVREAAEALGYSPSAAGRALSTGRSRRVGLVVTDLVNEFYPHVIAPLHHELERRGYELALLPESSDRGPVVEHVVGHGLAGVVLATATIDSVLPARLRERGVPFVYFGRTAGVDADAVVADPEDGVRQLVDAVAAGPPRRIGAIFGPRDTSTGRERESAVRSHLARRGLALDERDVRHGPFDAATGRDGAAALLGRQDPPALVVCGNDVVAVGALNAAVELGVAVPEDVGVVGFDDLPTARWPLVRLSTVAYDLDAMSRAAAHLLVDRVEGGPGAPARRVVFPTQYLARSTTPPPS